MSKFCTNCGNELKGNEKFCTKCGCESGNKVPQPLSVNFQDKSLDKIFKAAIVGLSILMILGTILPYMEVMGNTISLLWADGQVGDGIIYIILAVLCIVFVCLDKKIPQVVFSVSSFIMYCYENSQLKEAYGKIGSYSSLISRGAGYYLIAFVSIVLLIVCVLYFILPFINKGKAGIGK